MPRASIIAGAFAIFSFLCIVAVFIFEEIRFIPNESQFESYTVSEAAVDINTASIDELTALEGIGESTAKRIIEFRETQRPFDHIYDLTLIRGIGDKTIEKIKDQITVGAVSK